MTMDETGPTNMLREVFDAIPSLVFVVDQDVRIQEYNSTAAGLLMAERMTILKRRAGEVLHCLHSTEVQEGCGRAPFCKECIIRNSVMEAFQGNRVVRRRTKMEFIIDGANREMYALITVSPFRFQERALSLLVIEDISEIAEFRRMIPICAICKRVRTDRQSWMLVEAYFKKHWDVDFSHGLCPDCYAIERAKIERESKPNDSLQWPAYSRR